MTKQTSMSISKAAQSVINWIEKFLVIPDGKNVGKPIRLTDHQKHWLEMIYGSPTRRFILSIPRKQGKTAFSAMILLFELCARKDRKNAQLVSVAQTREQAGILYKLARDMMANSPYLCRKIKVKDSAKELIYLANNNTYKALSADASNALGLSPVVAFHDEVGQIKGQISELYNNIESAQGAHENPLSIVISTQAATDTDFFSILIDDAKDGNDPKTKVIVHSAPENLDPFSDEAIIAATPHLGVTVSMEYMREQAEAARRMPSMANAFKNLHLNQRVAMTEYFCSREVWMANAGAYSEDVFKSGRAHLGIDLSYRNDLTAVAMVAKDRYGNWHIKVWHYAPSENLKERSSRDHFDYQTMAIKGTLDLIPGGSIDNSMLAPQVIDIYDRYKPKSIGFDSWGMAALEREFDLLGRKLPLEKISQSFAGTTAAVDTLISALLNTKVRHQSNPLLNWCVANASTIRDSSGNLKLDKKVQTRRIDGLAAVITAMAAALKDETVDMSSSWVLQEASKAKAEGRKPEWQMFNDDY